jgi:hypothetical protein
MFLSKKTKPRFFGGWGELVEHLVRKTCLPFGLASEAGSIGALIH